MIWDGQTVYAVWGYNPITRWSITWQQVSNGSWRGSDRGIAEDVFESSMLFEGPIAELTALETVLSSNRGEFDITCDVGEELFGADLDYSSPLTVAPIQYGAIQQIGFKTFGLPLRLRLVETPAFVTTTPSLDTLRKSQHQDTRISEYDIKKLFTYDRAGFYADHASDPNTYSASFTQTTEEMKAIRRYLLATARATTLGNFFSGPFPPFDNIEYPFGTKEGNGPFSVKVLEWAESSRANFRDWNLNIKFGRVY